MYTVMMAHSFTLLFLPVVSRVLSYHFCSVASRYGWKAAKRLAMRSGYCAVSSFRLEGLVRLAGFFSSSSTSSWFSPSSLSTSSSSSDLLMEKRRQIKKLKMKQKVPSIMTATLWCGAIPGVWCPGSAL